jgi:hypothetical protein
VQGRESLRHACGRTLTRAADELETLHREAGFSVNDARSIGLRDTDRSTRRDQIETAPLGREKRKGIGAVALEKDRSPVFAVDEAGFVDATTRDPARGSGPESETGFRFEPGDDSGREHGSG